MSTGSSVFSSGHSFTSKTDIVTCTIWILHTSDFFFLYRIWKLLIYYLNFTEVLI